MHGKIPTSPEQFPKRWLWLKSGVWHSLGLLSIWKRAEKEGPVIKAFKNTISQKFKKKPINFLVGF